MNPKVPYHIESLRVCTTLDFLKPKYTEIKKKVENWFLLETDPYCDTRHPNSMELPRAMHLLDRKLYRVILSRLLRSNQIDLILQFHCESRSQHCHP